MSMQCHMYVQWQIAYSFITTFLRTCLFFFFFERKLCTPSRLTSSSLIILPFNSPSPTNTFSRIQKARSGTSVGQFDPSCDGSFLRIPRFLFSPVSLYFGKFCYECPRFGPQNYVHLFPRWTAVFQRARTFLFGTNRNRYFSQITLKRYRHVVFFFLSLS